MRQLYGFGDDTKKNKDDIAKMQAKLETVIVAVQQVVSDTNTDRQLAERDQENLLLRIQLALRDTEQRLLPSGASQTQTAEIAELRARVAALENEVAEHKKQIAALENDV